MKIDDIIAGLDCLRHGYNLIDPGLQERVAGEAIAKLREQEAALALADQGLQLAKYLDAQVQKHGGCVYVKSYYSEFRKMVSLMRKYEAIRGK